MLESAQSQLKVYSDKAYAARKDPDATAVLKRSESIYNQAVNNYNRTLHKPWVYPPAVLMGFRTIKKEAGNHDLLL